MQKQNQTRELVLEILSSETQTVNYEVDIHTVISPSSKSLPNKAFLTRI
jgi:hypothetical protein